MDVASVSVPTDDIAAVVATEIVEVVTKSSGVHCGNILSCLMKLRTDDIFCDVTIVCGDLEIKAHKNILASATDYFKAMFLNETNEARNGIIDFSKMSPEVMEQCIGFIYSGKVDISMTIARDLLNASEMMQIPELSQLCAEFLAERVDMKSCGEILSLSILYSNETLNESIEAFLVRDFEEYKETEDFKMLELEAVSKCIEYLENGGGSGEIRKWDAILTWLNHDLEDRKGHFVDLFGKVNLSVLPKTFLKDIVMPQSLVRTSNECLMKLAMLNIDEGSYASGKSLRRIFSMKSQVIIEHDLMTGKSKSIARFPGKFSSNVNAISYRGSIYAGDGVGMYRFRDGVWSERMTDNRLQIPWRCSSCRKVCQHCDTGKRDCYNRCIGVGGNVYMVTASSLYMYNVLESKLHRFNLNIKIDEGFLITASEERIYVMGGCKAIEIDIATKACSNLSDMPSSISAAAWFNGKIFTFHKPWRKDGLTVYCYNPESDHWTIVPGIECLRIPDSAYIGDKLYLIGGDKKEPFQTIDLQKLKIPEEVYFEGKCFVETF